MTVRLFFSSTAKLTMVGIENIRTWRGARRVTRVGVPSARASARSMYRRIWS